MNTKAFVLLFALITISSSASNLLLSTIDLEFDKDRKFQIKDKGDEVKSFLNKHNTIGLMPKKYYELIKNNFSKNNFKCYTKITYSGGLYNKFYCKKTRYVDFSTIKLNFNFENYTLSLTEAELFKVKGDDFYFNFLSNDKVNILTIPTQLLEGKTNV